MKIDNGDDGLAAFSMLDSPEVMGSKHKVFIVIGTDYQPDESP